MKLFQILLISYLVLGVLSDGESKEECTNINDEYTCSSLDQTTYPESYDIRSFQTPPRNDTQGNYRETYQDMHYLVGYSQLKYSSDRKICTITVITRVNPKLGEEGKDYKLLYKFDDREQERNIFTITSSRSYPDGMNISVRIVDMNGNEIAKLELEERP